MEMKLEINGTGTYYPEEIQNLEKLILYIMEHQISSGELIVEVKVNGELYSEPIEHQARQLDLSKVRKVEITTQAMETFAQEFLKEAPAYLDHIGRGLRASVNLLRDPGKKEKGYDMLVRSIETLQGIKSHLENVDQVLRVHPGRASYGDFWERFCDVTDNIMASLEPMNSIALADHIEWRMLPLLEEWKGILNKPQCDLA